MVRDVPPMYPRLAGFGTRLLRKLIHYASSGVLTRGCGRCSNGFYIVLSVPEGHVRRFRRAGYADDAVDPSRQSGKDPPVERILKFCSILK